MPQGFDGRLKEATNIDLRQLTVVGWLLVLITIGLFIWAIVWFSSLAHDLRLSKNWIKLFGIVDVVVCLGFFLGCRWSLEGLGIQIVRPLLQTNDETES